MLTLTNEEIEQITNRQRRSAQARMLAALGIRHKIRPDGSILVFRAAVEKLGVERIPQEPQMRLRNGPATQAR